MKKIRTALAMVLTLALGMALLTGCSNTTDSQSSGTQLATGGTLLVKVNPEIAVSYDEAGKVTKVESRNDDAAKLLAEYTGFEGKDTKEVVKELVTKIGEAGYFVEEIEGEKKTITIEIEKGSAIPDAAFIDGVVTEVRAAVNNKMWHSPVTVTGTTDYGITDYVDTDYGPDNDGNTDYGTYTDYGSNTDYGVNNDGATDYTDTDYGPDNDGVTDYNDTDYGVNNDGVTDYDDTDYGVNNDGVTDYNDTDYGPHNDGVTDYDDGQSDYTAPAPAPAAPSGNSDYGNTNYNDGGSDYDSGSNYGDSAYDD